MAGDEITDRALGVECRADDTTTRALLAALDDGPTRQSVLAERALLRGLGGGCLVPVGARASVEGGHLTLQAAVLTADGTRRAAGDIAGAADAAEEVGQRLAESLLGQGARVLLGR